MELVLQLDMHQWKQSLMHACMRDLILKLYTHQWTAPSMHQWTHTSILRTSLIVQIKLILRECLVLTAWCIGSYHYYSNHQSPIRSNDVESYYFSNYQKRSNHIVMLYTYHLNIITPELNEHYLTHSAILHASLNTTYCHAWIRELIQ